MIVAHPVGSLSNGKFAQNSKFLRELAWSEPLVLWTVLVAIMLSNCRQCSVTGYQPFVKYSLLKIQFRRRMCADRVAPFKIPFRRKQNAKPREDRRPSSWINIVSYFFLFTFSGRNLKTWLYDIINFFVRVVDFF